MDYEKKTGIPFGTFDSELIHQEINIPNGFKAVIDGNKIILTRAESEDEKIIKILQEGVNDVLQDQFCTNRGVSKEKVLSWLEKQGEQKPTIEMKSAEESLDIDSETYNKIVDECIYGEQKPIEWDEYDEVYVSALIAIVEKDGATGKNLRDGLTGKNLRNELIGWLRCLKGRFFKKISYETSGH